MSSFSAQPIPAAPPSPSSSAAPTTSSATLTPSSATRTPSSAALTPSPATPSPSSAPPTPSSATPTSSSAALTPSSATPTPSSATSTPSDLASHPILATQSSKKKHKDDPVAPVVSVLATCTVRDQSKASPIRSKNLLLPVGRVRSIVRSSPEVEIIGKEFLFTVTKATELFIIYLTKLSQKKGNNQEINYTDVVDVVDRKACMEFLEDFVPKKIKFSEYLSIMEEENMAEEKICSSFY